MILVKRLSIFFKRVEPVILKRKSVALIFVLFISLFQARATTYFTVAEGPWTGAIWSSACSTCTPGSALPVLVAGDIIVIDDRVTIASNTITIGPAVTIKIRTAVSPNTLTSPAKLIFTNGGKLVLTSASSKVVLENETGNPANNPQIDGTGNGASNIINIGGVQYWKANDGDVVGVGTLQPGGALPIKLISFEGLKSDHSVELKWVTAMERDFSHFEIERSNQNLNFVPIARVNGRGGLDVLTSYSYTDVIPEDGRVYYRLKSIDIDLTFEYSPVIVVDLSIEKQVTVYPNPTGDGSLIVHTNFSPQENDHVEIYNNMGLKLLGADVTGHESSLHFNSDRKHGTYLLRYISSVHTQVIRFVQ